MLTKTELINKIWSQENKYSLQAIAELRVRGWLCDGSLCGIAFCHAQLQGADLMEANLQDVDFHQASLDFANLSKAKLNGSKLRRVSLQGADFDHCDLTYTDLHKVNLRGARNLCDKQLSRARSLFGAIMPDGKPYDGRFNLPGDLAQAQWAKVDVNDPQAMANFFGVSTEVYLAGQSQVVTAQAA
jgi:uncharacterized protein YjbI with pentapeptide repeats